MPSLCYVPNCKNRHNKKKEAHLSFHAFPKKLQKPWLEAIGRDKSTLINQQRICSVHFNADDFEYIGVLKKLKPGTIPTKKLPNKNLNLLPLNVADTVKEPSSDVHSMIKTEFPFLMDPPLTSREMPSLTAPFTSESSISIVPVESILKRKLEEETMKSPPVSINAGSNIRTLRSKLPMSSSGSGSCGLLLASSNVRYDTTKVSASIRAKAKLGKLLHAYRPQYYLEIIKEQLKLAKDYQRKYNRTVKTSSRIKRKILSLQGVVNNLKKRFNLSSDAITALENTFEGIPLAIMKRMMYSLRAHGKMSRVEYPPEIRSFAITLQFYSPKGYDYVRRTYDLAFPAPRIIRTWLAKEDCSPGFSKPSLDSLKIRAQEYLNQNNRQLLCALMFDEMAIKREIGCEENTFWGYNDVGSSIQSTDNQQPATAALVLMVVAVNDNFKLPIGYFFINKLSGEERANVIREALIQLYDTAIKVLSITCNGPSAHFKMMQELGCNISDSKALKTYFNHPVNNEKVFVLCDMCHMLKLMRNNWTSSQIFVDPDGHDIKWDYVNKLHPIQQQRGDYLRNTLGKKHIEWKKAIMKVNLATKILSGSVADALEFLYDDLELEEFQGVEPTVKFIRTVDNLFHLLSSRNPFGRGMATPLKKENEYYWKPFLKNAVDYLLRCKNIDGFLLSRTIKKTPFIGFAVTTISLLEIYMEEVIIKKNLSNILTYKFSLDHLEQLFCNIRPRNGCTSNPNCVEFMRCYKRLLLHQDIRSNTGNCIAKDQTNILKLLTSSSQQAVDITDVHLSRISEEATEIHQEINILLPVDLSEFAENVISYISKFVIRMLKKTLKCSICLEALIFSEDVDFADSSLKLIYRKSQGCLMLPSQSLRKVCRITERKLQIVMKVHAQIPRGNQLIELLVKECQHLLLDANLFTSLSEHCFDISISETHHKRVLIQEIIEAYATIRINSLAYKIN